MKSFKVEYKLKSQRLLCLIYETRLVGGHNVLDVYECILAPVFLQAL